MPEQTAISTRCEIMLEGLIDYAGLFPPADLSMQSIVANWSTFLKCDDAWMLGRLIIPAKRLNEFKDAAATLLSNDMQEPWQLSVLLPEANADGFSAAVQHVVAFNESNCGAVANVVEFKATTSSEIDAALSVLHDDLFPFIEIPIDRDPRGLIAALAGSVSGAKVRTGGVTPEMYPTAIDLARFIHGCAIAKQTFKATAGLHHPQLHHNASVGVDEYGFLAVLHATAAAGFNDAPIDHLVAILQAKVVDMEWCGDEILERTRAELFCSFGSCSFDDPRSDLREMKLLKDAT